jgi:hypothetical protein
MPPSPRIHACDIGDAIDPPDASVASASISSGVDAGMSVSIRTRISVGSVMHALDASSAATHAKRATMRMGLHSEASRSGVGAIVDIVRPS